MVSILLIVKSLEHLFVLEYERMIHISTATKLISESIRQQLFSYSNLSNKQDDSLKQFSIIFRNLLEMQSPTVSLFEVYSACSMLCDQSESVLSAVSTFSHSNTNRNNNSTLSYSNSTYDNFLKFESHTDADTIQGISSIHKPSFVSMKFSIEV